MVKKLLLTDYWGSTSQITHVYDAVVIEDLNMRGMAQGLHLASGLRKHSSSGYSGAENIWNLDKIIEGKHKKIANILIFLNPY